jgi:hypothetical protein
VTDGLRKYTSHTITTQCFNANIYKKAANILKFQQYDKKMSCLKTKTMGFWGKNKHTVKIEIEQSWNKFLSLIT